MIDQIRKSVAEFIRLVPSMSQPKEFTHTVTEVQDKARAWNNKWSASPGVYVFISRECIQYVGKAMSSTGLAARVNNGAQEGETAWNGYLADPSAVVVILEVSSQDEIWVPSLEYYLIKSLQPSFNKRLG